MRVTRHPYAVEGWGVGELWEADGRVVVAHDAPRERAAPGSAPRRKSGAGRPAANDPPTHPRGTPGVPTGTLAAADARPGDGFVPELLLRIARYYRGARVEFTDVPLDLEWCTRFQRDVAEALRRVPWGDVVSYGELAAVAGHPRAHRAVGTFCAGNRYALFLPCHRVVAAGGIGSYGPSGVATKRRLLRLEGHAAL